MRIVVPHRSAPPVEKARPLRRSLLGKEITVTNNTASAKMHLHGLLSALRRPRTIHVFVGLDGTPAEALSHPQASNLLNLMVLFRRGTRDLTLTVAEG